MSHFRWLPTRVGARTLYIELRSPWENGYIESFSGKLRDELLDREIFYTLLEVRVLTERYWRAYNQVRPHSSPGSSSLVMVGIGAPEASNRTGLSTKIRLKTSRLTK